VSRRLRVRRDLVYVVDPETGRTETCPAGEIVREAELSETGRVGSEFRRLLSGRVRGGEPRRSGALILFEWAGGFRVAEYGRDLETAESRGWRT